MTHSPTRRYLIAIGEILLITATSLTLPLWSTQPAELRKPRRGALYVRVVTVTVRGESAPSQATWVARAKKLANTKNGGRALE